MKLKLLEALGRKQRGVNDRMRLRTLRKILWAAAGAALAFATLLLMADRKLEPAVDASFRPTFAIPDAEGRLRTTAEFAGKYLLVFFGFTNCPDVCPTTLADIAQVMDDLGNEATHVQPLFVSIDPERDLRLGLAEFTAAFHPSILGLAGNADQTKAAADSFRIHYAREDDAAAPDGYTMSHSPSLYLVGPDGDWLRQFTYGTPAADILADIQSRI